MNERTWVPEDSRGAGRGLKQLKEEGQRGISRKEREGILGQGKRALLALPLPPPSHRACARTQTGARVQGRQLPAPHLKQPGTPSQRPAQIAPAASLVSAAAPHPSQGGLSAGPDSVPGQPSPVSCSSRKPRLHLGGKQ